MDAPHLLIVFVAAVIGTLLPYVLILLFGQTFLEIHHPIRGMIS